MTAITREYLDRFIERHADHDQDRHCDECGEAFPCGYRVMAAALRRVLDLHRPMRIYDECDHDHPEDWDGWIDTGDFLTCAGAYMESICCVCCVENPDDPEQSEWCANRHNHRDGDPLCPTLAALAGTQTDDGEVWVDVPDDAPSYSTGWTQTDDGAEVISAPATNGDEPAPSSPDRIEVAERALREASGPEYGTYPAAAEHVVAALDAYDREHPSPEVERLGAMVEWMAEVIVDARELLTTERRRYVGDLRGSRPHGRTPVDVEAVLAILDRERNAHPSALDRVTRERDQAVRDLADLRERIAADIEADVLLSPFSGGREVNAYNHGARNAASHAARIVRSGVPRTEEARTGPHSRACGIKRHDHGTECHSNCPTCRGSEVPR